MTTSYNDILNNMKNDYYSKCGNVLDMNSETGARFESVASELFSLYCYGDFVSKQAFPQTATKQYLEYHAQMRDILRKKPTKSKGTLRFYCSEDCQSIVKIPAGTVCSDKKNSFIQFVTVEDKTIDPSVQKFVDVMAESIGYGYENNAKALTITNIVNPPVGVVSVTNRLSFKGGMDEETDTSLRQRILDAYSVCPNGYSNQSIESSVLKCEGVRKCFVRIDSKSGVEICVETIDGKVSDELSNEIREKLFLDKIIDSPITILPAIGREYGLVVEIYKDDNTNDSLDSEIKNSILEVANSIGIEQDVNLSRFVSAISNISGVKYCEISSDSAVQGIIYANKYEVLRNNGLRVIYYDTK